MGAMAPPTPSVGRFAQLALEIGSNELAVCQQRQVYERERTFFAFLCSQSADNGGHKKLFFLFCFVLFCFWWKRRIGHRKSSNVSLKRNFLLASTPKKKRQKRITKAAVTTPSVINLDSALRNHERTALNPIVHRSAVPIDSTDHPLCSPLSYPWAPPTFSLLKIILLINYAGWPNGQRRKLSSQETRVRFQPKSKFFSKESRFSNNTVLAILN